MNISEKAVYGRELHGMLLRYEPIAVKMIEDEKDVPDSHNKTRLGKHVSSTELTPRPPDGKPSTWTKPRWCWCPWCHGLC